MRAASALLVPGLFVLAACAEADVAICPPGSDYYDPRTGECAPNSQQEHCPGTWAPGGRVKFEDAPVLLWLGEPGTAPDCPGDVEPWDGYADLLVSDYTCEPCACKPPTGSCVLPSQITAHAALCPGTGAIATPFDAPASWSGGCTGSNPIPGGALCNGSPCVQSVTVEPPQVMDNGCGVVVPDVPKKWLEPIWQTQGRTCVVGATPSQQEPGKMCVNASTPLPEGFRLCVEHQLEGDYSSSCDEDYPNPVVLYKGFENGRGCSACSCGPVQGSVCSMDLLLYETSGCSSIATGFYNLRSDQGPKCNDVMAGIGLTSKAVLNVEYTPGVCQAQGGEPVGEVKLLTAQTFCCQ